MGRAQNGLERSREWMDREPKRGLKPNERQRTRYKRLKEIEMKLVTAIIKPFKLDEVKEVANSFKQLDEDGVP